MDILKTLKEKQILVIWVTALILLISLIVVTTIISLNKPKVNAPEITTSLTTTDSVGDTRLGLSNSMLSNVDIADQLPVYKTQNSSMEVSLDAFISNNALGLTKGQCDNSYCSWSGEKGFIEVDYNYSYVYIKLNKAIKISTSIESLSSDNYSDYFNDFVKNELGLDFEYIKVSFNRENDFFRLKLGRAYDGKQIFTFGYQDFSEYALADSSGNFLEAQVSIFEVINSSKTMYSAIPSSQIGALINTANYPKSIFWGAEATEKTTTYNPVPIPNSEAQNGIIGKTTNAEKPAVCQADSISIEYFYSNSLESYMIPVYKIHCTGTVTVDGVEIIIPGVVYASSINPLFIK